MRAATTLAVLASVRVAVVTVVTVTAVAAPAAAQVPTPADIIGFAPGTDYELANYEQIHAYFMALDRASDRVVVEEIGRSTRDRPLIVAAISTADNLRDSDRYRAIARRLALARDLTDEEARTLARDGKAIVWIDGGLHATEVAHGQLTPELAHHLATDESEETRWIRENTIVLVMANMNPDGLDIVHDWYRSVLGTPFETSSVPELYHHYIGHDNNRDWYMFTQVETQAVARQLYHEWYPQIVYNHHQSGPFPGRIWTPPFENPVNPNLDPLVVSSINHIGEAIKKRFDEEGKPGVSSGIVYDMWWNGSMRGAPDFHNMLGFLTETALYRYATPGCYEEGQIPQSFGARADNLPARTPSTNYTNPWLGGCWHIRDAMDYMMTASLAVADQAAELKEDYLFNIYRMGKRQTERGMRAEGGPFAYIIDMSAQQDASTAVELLQIFRTAGIEIRRAERAFNAGGSRYDAGTYVIGPQAFRPFVVDLMEPKAYPDRRLYPGGPPEPPYDMTGYELRFQLGVTVDRVMERFEVPDRVVEEVLPDPGGVTGDASYAYLLAANTNASYAAVNRLLAGGARVSRATEALGPGGASWPAGTFVVQEASGATLTELATELGVSFTGLAEAPASATQPLRTPLIGLYRSWAAPMPEGWTRWVFDQFGFRWESLTDDDLRGGDLDRFDVIVLPDQSVSGILNGHAPGTMPERYTGGMGLEGALALERYVQSGGWVIAFDEAVDFAIDQFGLPVRNVARGLEAQDFFIPGSLIRVDVDNTDPLAHGMPGEAVALFARSQVLQVVPPASQGRARATRDVDVYARYAREDFLVSGWDLGGERYLAGRPAAVRVPLGRGQVVLLAFSPHFRGQPRNAYKLLFNPLLMSTQRDVPIS